MKAKFYRYDAYGGEDGARLHLTEMHLYKETPKGYWVSQYPSVPRVLDKTLRKWNYIRWVSKTSRKRYCYPTRKEALTSFIARTERRLVILRSQISTCEEALEMAKGMKAEMEQD